MQRLRLLLLGSALGLVSAASVSAFPIGPACLCPDNYLPVVCSNGQVYGNACEARCAGATGCVLTPIFP